MTPNPTMMRCATCDSELKRFVPDGWRMPSSVLFGVTTVLTVWLRRPPVLLGAPIVVVMAWFWAIAAERVYHSLWLWKHPKRCGDHGHPATAPDAT